MSWSNIISTTLNNITTRQYFPVVVSLNPKEIAHCTVTATLPSSNAIITIFASLDGTNWDTISVFQYYIDRSYGSPGQVSFLVGGYYKFKVGIESDNIAYAITSATFSYRLDSQ